MSYLLVELYHLMLPQQSSNNQVITLPILGEIFLSVINDRICANRSSIAHAYSAKAPWHAPNTSSPGLNWITFLPTASTWPATSRPSRVSFGLSSPNSKRPMYGLPLISLLADNFDRVVLACRS